MSIQIYSVYLLAIIATPIDRAHCTTGHVFSAHAHMLHGGDRQTYVYNVQFSDHTQHRCKVCVGYGAL